MIYYHTASKAPSFNKKKPERTHIPVLSAYFLLYVGIKITTKINMKNTNAKQ